MKKIIALAFALVCVLALSSGTLPVIAQEEEDDPETACDHMEAAMNQACQDLEDAVEMLKRDDITLGDFQRLARRCDRFSDTYREECGPIPD